MSILYWWISEWLLSNTNWAILQLYHDKNKLFWCDADDVLDQHAKLDIL
jgi:hypothetical protein